MEDNHSACSCESRHDENTIKTKKRTKTNKTRTNSRSMLVRSSVSLSSLSSSSSSRPFPPYNISCLITKVAMELESMRFVPKHDGIIFPKYCRRLVMSLMGNDRCVDCGYYTTTSSSSSNNNNNTSNTQQRPDWASITYGTLLCVQCSGIHRSYGVQTSYIKSISMDTWSHEQVLAMLEGGNEQIQQFFNRHKMGNNYYQNNHNVNVIDSTISQNKKMGVKMRYQTKAAQFYRINLLRHVKDISMRGIYEGREVSRRCWNTTTTNNYNAPTDASCCNNNANVVVNSNPNLKPKQQQQQQQPLSLSTTIINVNRTESSSNHDKKIANNNNLDTKKKNTQHHQQRMKTTITTTTTRTR